MSPAEWRILPLHQRQRRRRMTDAWNDDDRDLPGPEHPASAPGRTALRPAEASEISRDPETAGAIADYKSFIEANGLPLARCRKF